MAGFETIVRPVVFPNIRPTPKQSVRPQEAASDDPEKGMCVIRGSSGKIVQLPYSYSTSVSKSRPVETERRFDEVRIFQQDNDGTVNKENFIDIEVPNKITMRTGSDGGDGSSHPGMGDATNIDYWYAREIEKENTEIRKKNEIRKNEEAGE